MASLNQCNFIGNLGRDPETRYMTNGDPVCNFSIACSESWKDKNTGEKKEATEWINVVIYGKLAEVAGNYLKKGSQVFISGKMKTRKWQDKDGNDRYTTEIHVNDMKMLGGKPADGQQQGGGNGGGRRSAPPAAAPAARQAPPKQSFDDLGDDIPF